MIFGFDEFGPLMIIVDEEIEMLHEEREEENNRPKCEIRANKHRTLEEKGKRKKENGKFSKIWRIRFRRTRQTR